MRFPTGMLRAAVAPSRRKGNGYRTERPNPEALAYGKDLEISWYGGTVRGSGCSVTSACGTPQASGGRDSLGAHCRSHRGDGADGGLHYRPDHPVATIIAAFVRRWNIEVTFEETRRHLGVETQRQWADRAIARTTPALFALFSLVCLMALRLVAMGHALPIRMTAWYRKSKATFSDVLAMVSRILWAKSIS